MSIRVAGLYTQTGPDDRPTAASMTGNGTDPNRKMRSSEPASFDDREDLLSSNLSSTTARLALVVGEFETSPLDLNARTHNRVASTVGYWCKNGHRVDAPACR